MRKEMGKDHGLKLNYGKCREMQEMETGVYPLQLLSDFELFSSVILHM